MAEFNFPNKAFSYTAGGDCGSGCPEGQFCDVVYDSVKDRDRSNPYAPATATGARYQCVKKCEFEEGMHSVPIDQQAKNPITGIPVGAGLPTTGSKPLPVSLAPGYVPGGGPRNTPIGSGPGTQRYDLTCVQCLQNDEISILTGALYDGKPHQMVSQPQPCRPPLKQGHTHAGRGGVNIAWPEGTGPNTHTVDTAWLTCPRWAQAKLPNGKWETVHLGGAEPCPIVPKPSSRVRTVTSRAFMGSPTSNPVFAQPSTTVSSIRNETYTNQNLSVTTQADFDNTIGAVDPTNVQSVSYTTQPQQFEHSSQSLDGGLINEFAQSVDPDILDRIIDHVASNLCANNGTYTLPQCGSGESFVISTGSCESVDETTVSWPADTLNNVLSRVDSRIQLKRKNKLLEILNASGDLENIIEIANAAETAVLNSSSLTKTQTDLVLEGVSELHTVWDDPNYATAEDHLASVVKSMNKIKDNIGNQSIISLLTNAYAKFTDLYTQLLTDCESNTYPDSGSIAVALATSHPYLLLAASRDTRRPKPRCVSPKVFNYATSKCECPAGYYNCDNAVRDIFGRILKESECIKCLPPKILFNENGKCGCKCPAGQVECAKTGGCMPECNEGLQRASSTPCGECVCVERRGISELIFGGALAVLAPGPNVIGARIGAGLDAIIGGGRPQIINDANCNSKIPGSIVKKNRDGCYCDCPDGKVAQQCKQPPTGSGSAYPFPSGYPGWDKDPYGGFMCTDPCYSPKVWDPETCECVCPPCYLPLAVDPETCECVCPDGEDCGSGSSEGGGF